jgi:hypothetical protein
MKKLYFIATISAFAVATTVAVAQCTSTITTTASTVCSGGNVTLNVDAVGPANSLSTTFAAGNNHRGNMFDISATNSVIITSFDAHPMGNTTIEIYYKTGTYVGSENSPASWTLIGSAAVIAQPIGTPTPVPVAINVTIPAGQTYGFYVTSTNTLVSLNYTNGTAVGNILAGDANIAFHEGAGMEYPFTGGTGSVFTPRDWNGVIHYAVIGASTTYLWNTTETTQSINPTVSSSSLYSCTVSTSGCPTMNPSINIAVSVPPVNGGADQTVCSGTAVTLSGSGAVSYSWDNSVTDGVAFIPASSGMYMVTGTDSIGCTAMDMVDLTVNPLPAVFGGSDFALCYGTTANISGTGAVSYTWNNGVIDVQIFTPVSTASYIVTGTDANGCMNSDTMNITVNPLPTVYGGVDQTICDGSQLTLTGSGATTYSWDNFATDGVPFIPLFSASFIVTGTDANGCSNTDTVYVTLNPVPTVDAGADQNICSGNSVTLNGSGALTYSWDNGVMDGVSFTPAGTQTYNVTGTDANGCAGSDAVTVTVNSVNVATSFLNETITASQGGATYQWINCSNNQPIANATNQSYTATANGSYAVIVTDNGCSDTSACQTISSVGINEYSERGISVYPNPTDGKITVATGNNSVNEISVIDAFGRTIETIKPENSTIDIDLQSYADGLYFIRISSSDSMKMVKVTKK